MKKFVNVLTISRIVGSIVLCFLDVLTIPFYIVYVYSGLTDFLDGFLARKFNVVSKLGSNLDSVADLTYYTVMMIKMWPYLCMHLNLVTWIIIWSVLSIRLLLYIIVQLKYHHLVSSHHFLNKLTGVMMFILPFIANKSFFGTYSFIVSIIAVIACIYEAITIRSSINKGQ